MEKNIDVMNEIQNTIRLNAVKEELLREDNICKLTDKIDAIPESDVRKLLKMFVMAG